MTVPIETLARGSRVSLQVPVVERIERNAAGYWYVYLRVQLDFTLPDGRTIIGEKLVPIRCRQEGRKKYMRREA